MEVSGRGNPQKMESGNPRGANAAQVSVKLSGSVLLFAPVQSWRNAIPSDAYIVRPISNPPEDMAAQLEKGPVLLTDDQMWKMLGINGRPIQVQGQNGEPMVIGHVDMLAALEQSWKENTGDLDRSRVYGNELARFEMFDKAEEVLASIIATGEALGPDWFALGRVQRLLKKYAEAEGTLTGAQNLMADSPIPSLELAKLANDTGNQADELKAVLRAISINRRMVDPWAYYFNFLRERDGEEAAIKAIEKEAGGIADAKNAAPFLGIQDYYASKEETRDKAIKFAEKAVERSRDDALALLVLSALYGAVGNIKAAIALLAPHEAKMVRDARLANNYVGALFQDNQLDKVTKLLNVLAGSPDQNVKQFALDRSRAVAEILQQRQRQIEQAKQNLGNVATGNSNRAGA